MNKNVLNIQKSVCSANVLAVVLENQVKRFLWQQQYMQPKPDTRSLQKSFF